MRKVSVLLVILAVCTACTLGPDYRRPRVVPSMVPTPPCQPPTC